MKRVIRSNDQIFPWHLHPNSLFEFGQEIGINANELLSAAKLTQRQIDNLDLHVNWHQYLAMVELVSQAHPNDWGFEFGKRLPLGSHGLISLVMMNCTHWSQIVGVIDSYAILVSPLLYIETRKTQSHYIVTVHPEFTAGPYLQQFAECFFTIMYQSISEFGSVNLVNRSNDICVLLKGDTPDTHDAIRTVFHGNIRWGNYANQMRFSQDLVNQEIANANPVAADSMRKVLHAQLSQLTATKGCLHELRDLFVKGTYKQDDCAKALHTSTPTLKRLLRQSATSFSEELTRYRIEQACWELKYGVESISKLSDELGFQDVASFRRLFKKELNTTPMEFRTSPALWRCEES